MAWSITDRFPTWGESGEFPPDGFFYEGGDQVNEKHLDALWDGIKGFENETRSALEDIDSDGDGKVDAAEEADNADTLDGEDASAFANTNHGNEEHSSDFTTLTEVNNNADVPNADYADSAGDADTLDGEEATAFADATHDNTAHSENYTTPTEAANAAPVQSVGGETGDVIVVFKQDTPPSDTTEGNIWVDTSVDPPLPKTYSTVSNSYESVIPTETLEGKKKSTTTTVMDNVQLPNGTNTQTYSVNNVSGEEITVRADNTVGDGEYDWDIKDANGIVESVHTSDDNPETVQIDLAEITEIEVTGTSSSQTNNYGIADIFNSAVPPHTHPI